MTELIDEGRPAATVVIVRDRPQARPEILMMERATTMAFAGGALVFPGGGVDAADRAWAADMADVADVDEVAARLAAIRETLEESGLGVGFATSPDQLQLSEMRAALTAGNSLRAIVEAQRLELALDQLVPFSRWHPARSENAIRIYDTRFYAVRAPDGQEASADATENIRLFWSSAEATIARCDAGNGRIIFPTRRNLERLALFDSFADIAAHAASIPVEKIRPWLEERDGQPHLCIPDHLGYPVTSEPINLVHRA